MQPVITWKPSARADFSISAASVRPPVLSSLRFTAWYRPRNAARSPPTWTDSSAHTVNGGSQPSRSWSASAGSGCSTRAIGRSARRPFKPSRIAKLQPSFGSMMKRERGAAAATARRRAAGSSADSLILISGASATARAAAPMASGVSRLTVTAVTRADGTGRPVAAATLPPVRLARRSHSARSRALRAAPGGRAAQAASTSAASRAGASWASTLSTVSP